jgi:hypothetical protein
MSVFGKLKDPTCGEYRKLLDKMTSMQLRLLLGKTERKITIGRPTLRWENNIKMDLQEVGWGT